jgi:hypothetical protein
MAGKERPQWVVKELANILGFGESCNNPLIGVALYLVLKY